MLRLANEDNTLMDIHQALDILEQNALTINKRRQQLRDHKGVVTSEYQDYLVARSAFPTPRIELRGSKP
jgi:hypothetical protein